MRLTEIAARLSEATGRDDAKIHIALRAPAMKALLQFTPGPTPKSPGDYAPIELVRARLLLAGQACGLSVTELERVNHRLNENITPKKAGMVPTHLAELAKGADWIIRIRYAEGEAGERHAYVGIGPEEDLPVGETRASRTLHMINATTELGYLTIPAATLIKPLLSLIPKAEG